MAGNQIHDLNIYLPVFVVLWILKGQIVIKNVIRQMVDMVEQKTEDKRPYQINLHAEQMPQYRGLP